MVENIYERDDNTITLERSLYKVDKKYALSARKYKKEYNFVKHI